MKKKRKINNYSNEHKKYLKKIKIDKTTTLIAQILIFCAIVGLWELLTATKVLDPFFLSSPSRIFTTLVDTFANGNMLYHIGITLYETIVGFILATALGTFIAILLWWSNKLRNILDP